MSQATRDRNQARFEAAAAAMVGVIVADAVRGGTSSPHKLAVRSLNLADALIAAAGMVPQLSLSPAPAGEPAEVTELLQRVRAVTEERQAWESEHRQAVGTIREVLKSMTSNQHRGGTPPSWIKGLEEIVGRFDGGQGGNF